MNKITTRKSDLSQTSPQPYSTDGIKLMETVQFLCHRNLDFKVKNTHGKSFLDLVTGRFFLSRESKISLGYWAEIDDFNCKLKDTQTYPRFSLLRVKLTIRKKKEKKPKRDKNARPVVKKYIAHDFVAELELEVSFFSYSVL